jgi:hypothetical protein
MPRKSWNPVVKAPRHLAGAVSARYTGAACHYPLVAVQTSDRDKLVRAKYAIDDVVVTCKTSRPVSVSITD